MRCFYRKKPVLSTLFSPKKHQFVAEYYQRLVGGSDRMVDLVSRTKILISAIKLFPHKSFSLHQF